MSDEKNINSSLNPEAEPKVERSTLPMWILAATLLLLYLGFVYFDHHSGWFDPQVYTPYADAGELDAYQPKSGAAAAIAHGKQVYEQVCGLCHGNDGLGKPGQAPPLAGSEWVNAKSADRLAHIPLAGLNGSVPVKGKDWNLSMPPMGAAMSDSDLADVLSYVRSSWGNKAGVVTPNEIKKVRAALGAHPQPLSGAELQKMPE
jgi:mono/diheme cytochrome c family protein